MIPAMIRINDTRVMIRLCSPLPAAPMKCESRMAIARLDAAIKKRVKNVDMIFATIASRIHGQFVQSGKLAGNNPGADMKFGILP